jgi:hypothetical protein
MSERFGTGTCEKSDKHPPTLTYIISDDHAALHLTEYFGFIKEKKIILFS